MAVLTLLDRSGHEGASFPLGREPLYIGRGATNGLVLDGRSISGQHASIWEADGAVWLQDLGSRNGTFRANGKRVRGPTKIPSGEVIRLGTDAKLKVSGVCDPGSSPVPMVCFADGSAAFPMHGSRLVLGRAPEADLVMEGEAVLTVEPDGTLKLLSGGSTRVIAYGERFTVGGKDFLVKGTPEPPAATWDAERDSYRYALSIVLDGPQGATATLADPTGHTHTIGAENRAMLLYVLARQLGRDRRSGTPHTMAGWIADTEIATALWGKGGAGRNLNVLVTRVRNEVKAAGFDPWFIEKRRGQTRLQLEDVSLKEPGP